MATRLLQLEELLHLLTGQTRPRTAAVNRDLARLRKQLQLPGVTGLSVGWRSRAGKQRRELCLKVFVESKKTREELERRHVLPRRVAAASLEINVPVDVEQTGRLELVAGTPAPVLEGGELIRHFQGPPGSLGCIVRPTDNPAAVALLSCSHVIAKNGFAPLNDAILRLQTGSQVAALARVRPFDTTPGAANVDAAIATLVGSPPPPFAAAVSQIGPIAGFRSWDSLRDATSPGGGEPVRMFSPKRGQVLRGTITDKRRAVTMTFANFPDPPNPLEVPFQNQLVCSFDAQAGDSGSVLVDAQGNVAGLVWLRQAADGAAMANPIDLVLGALGVRPAT